MIGLAPAIYSDAKAPAIFTTHCQLCEHCDVIAQTCALCVWHVGQSGETMLNKVKLDTEHGLERKW